MEPFVSRTFVFVLLASAGVGVATARPPSAQSPSPTDDDSSSSRIYLQTTTIDITRHAVKSCRFNCGAAVHAIRSPTGHTTTTRSTASATTQRVSKHDGVVHAFSSSAALHSEQVEGQDNPSYKAQVVPTLADKSTHAKEHDHQTAHAHAANDHQHDNNESTLAWWSGRVDVQQYLVKFTRQKVVGEKTTATPPSETPPNQTPSETPPKTPSGTPSGHIYLQQLLGIEGAVAGYVPANTFLVVVTSEGAHLLMN
jgi:hypothetical protein